MKQPSASSNVSIRVSRNQLTNTLAGPTCGDSSFCRRWHTVSLSSSSQRAMKNWLM